MKGCNHGFIDVFGGKKLQLHFSTYPSLNLALYARNNGDERVQHVKDACAGERVSNPVYGAVIG